MRALLMAALLAGGAQAAEPAKTATGVKAAGVEAPKERIPTDVRRLTILVRDIDNSLKLYRDVFGLQVNYDAKISVSGVALPAGVPGNKTRLVLLNGNDPFIGWIGLMQYTDPPLPGSDQPYPRRLGPGGHVLILNVDDAKKRCAMAATVPGVSFTGEARLQVYEGRNGAPPIRVMGCNIFDPDGTAIEINQILRD
ncbi:VOC family protein [Sandaracinobacteroides saxicola]|uniref:VOC family protein n=1 Tax=Sandaracinobacteroides saxicola TaxID=2759707 RepID=A0A7G5IG44_9SPHN|nr:VOC family protein [Sandaracinobacteroides saxicola]QMW22336.1 VOC family protein [Sandaracinobacteroides saxicola]